MKILMTVLREAPFAIHLCARSHADRATLLAMAGCFLGGLPRETAKAEARHPEGGDVTRRGALGGPRERAVGRAGERAGEGRTRQGAVVELREPIPHALEDEAGFLVQRPPGTIVVVIRRQVED